MNEYIPNWSKLRMSIGLIEAGTAQPARGTDPIPRFADKGMLLDVLVAAVRRMSGMNFVSEANVLAILKPMGFPVEKENDRLVVRHRAAELQAQARAI